MNRENNELSEWAKLVNRILHEQRMWEEEKRNFD
jgi:hypothetical protein